jgi:hypothetical protein
MQSSRTVTDSSTSRPSGMKPTQQKKYIDDDSEERDADSAEVDQDSDDGSNLEESNESDEERFLKKLESNKKD